MLIDCSDVLGRRIQLDNAYWIAHVLTQRPWMDGWHINVEACLTQPDSIMWDKSHANRECFYKLGTPLQTNKHLKVVVEFDTEEIGKVITAYPTRTPSQGEQHKWP